MPDYYTLEEVSSKILEDLWFHIPYNDKDMESVRQLAIKKIKEVKL